MYGHQGKLLRVDLSSGHIEEESYTADYAKMFLGGNGFAAKMICDSVPADADPLGPENAVVFTVNPLTDTPVWGASRGVSRKDDTLPLRVMSEPIPDGPLKGRFCPPKDLDAMLETYYELRGWTREGIPTEGKLKELGLV